MASDFSGLGSFELAAKRVAQVLGCRAEVMFSSDSDKHCQAMLLHNHCPFKFYPDDAITRMPLSANGMAQAFLASRFQRLGWAWEFMT